MRGHVAISANTLKQDAREHVVQGPTLHKASKTPRYNRGVLLALIFGVKGVKSPSNWRQSRPFLL